MAEPLNSARPVVTVLIATKDRPDDLRRTLGLLRAQTWPAVELIVIDDASAASLEPIVRERWPDAVYVRKAESAGQCRRRSEGFRMAAGKYILQLDDDSCPVQPGALDSAVQFMEADSEIGILSFYIFNGPELTGKLPEAEPRYHQSFVGCGALLRTEAVREIGGYQDFFGNEWEEEELSLRMMKAGWAIYFFPSIVVHHHVSPRNRKQARTWSRGFRNKLWSLIMHLPARRLPLEMSWVLAIGFYDSIRLLRFGAYLQGVGQFLKGIPKVARMRRAMPDIVLRRYDALRFQSIRTKEEYRNPPAFASGDVWNWLRSWWRRPRQRSFWDRRPGDTGESPTVKFAHEFHAGEPGGPKP